MQYIGNGIKKSITQTLQCEGNLHCSIQGCTIPLSSVGFASKHRKVLSTSQDAVGIFQYLLAMPVPLSHCTMPHLKGLNSGLDP